MIKKKRKELVSGDIVCGFFRRKTVLMGYIDKILILNDNNSVFEHPVLILHGNKIEWTVFIEDDYAVLDLT